jgi:hypothetical protein
LLSAAAAMVAGPASALPTPTVQQQINQAIESGVRHVRIQPGTYRLDERLLIREANNLTIDATGVKLIFTVSDMKPILIARCNDLTLKGLTIDFDPLPFVQGPVTRIKPDQGYFEMEIEAGYPDIDRTYIRKRTAHVFDPETGYWEAGASNKIAQRIKILSPRSARLFVLDRARFMIDGDDPIIELGDTVVINTRARECFAVVETDNFTLDGTVIHTAPGIAILGRWNTGTHTIKNVKIVPGPRPEGATTDRMISTCADAVNYAGMRGKLIITGCEFSRMADDTLNIAAVTTRVVEVEDSDTFLGITRHAEYMLPGDVLEFFEPADLSPLGQAKIISAEQIDTTEAQRNAFLQATGIHVPERLIGKIEIARFHLDAPVDLAVGQHVNLPAFSTGGYEVTDNHFHDHRARGLRVQVDNGLIENNRFERIQQAAITIGPEMRPHEFWASGWSKNIVVRHNTFLDIGRGQHIAVPWTSTPGAIAVDSAKFRDIEPTYAGHRDIVIEGNTIDGCSVSAIHVAAVDGLTIRDNTIARVNRLDPTDVAVEVDMNPTHAVMVLHCQDVTVEDNQFEDPGAHSQGEVLIRPQ